MEEWGAFFKGLFSGPSGGALFVATLLALAMAAPPVRGLVREWRRGRMTVNDDEDSEPGGNGASKKGELSGRVAVLEAGYKGQERRSDRHSRILTQVQTELAETRGDLCARLEAVEKQQDNTGTLVQKIAIKLGVIG